MRHSDLCGKNFLMQENVGEDAINTPQQNIVITQIVKNLTGFLNQC